MDSKLRRYQAKSQRNNGYLAFLLVLLIIGLVIFAFIAVFISNNNIHEGIIIDNTDIGGMNIDNAFELLNKSNNLRLNEFRLTLKFKDKIWQYDYYDIGAMFDDKKSIERAHSIGREGNILTQIINTYQLRAEPITLSSQFAYNKDKLTGKLYIIKDEIDKPAVDAQVKFYPDRDIKFEIIPEDTGLELNINKVMSDIDNLLNESKLDIEIELKPDIVYPDVSVESLSGKTERLITFGTDLSNSADDRTHNVLLAAEAFNGMVVQPGEIVSFNGTVGERTLEKGYKSAPMIVSDKSLQDAPGGGVSQTSTTLYNAALRAGLEIVEFVRHSYPVGYIIKGLDTTVNLPTPVIDLKFKNNKEYPIYIRTFYDNNNVFFELYGEPLSDGKKIKIRTEEYESVPAPEVEYISDKEGLYVKYKDEEFEKVKSRCGYKVRVYREIYKDDNLIESELIDDHYYRPIKGTIYTGVEERPDVDLTIENGDEESNIDGSNEIELNIIDF